MNRYRCGTPGASVDLIAPPPLAARVAELVAPFVTVTPGDPAGAADGWQLRVASAAPAGYRPVELVAEGEPPIRLWLAAANRELLVDPAAPEAFVVQCLVRYLRELLRAARTRDLFLHAGLAARDGAGVVVVGGKRAGKTSTLIALLLAGWRFVGNDDVSLADEPAAGGATGWWGYGWPRAVSVRDDTFAALGLNPDMVDPSHPVHRRPGSRLLRPAELARLCHGAPPVADAPVRALVFPRFTAEPGRPRLVELAPEQAADRLLAAAGPNPPAKNAFLTGLFPPVPADVTRARVRRLATDVAAFALTQPFSELRAGAHAIERLVQTGEQSPA